MIKNYKAIVEYDGSSFYGWQRLRKKRTVQHEIEKYLKKILGKNIKINGSGRTDALVHSTGQVINFKVDLKIPLSKFREIINENLPSDIYFRAIEIMNDDFHARYSAKYKQYRYKIYTHHDKKVLLNKYYYHFPYTLDLEKMKKASEKIIGEHDFRSFIAKSVHVENSIREIKSIHIIGNGFLYKMVRTIVGNLLAVARGKISLEEFEKIIHARDIKAAKDTAPANGLYLEEVFY
jgi:tRNA pseudouridine38-40 synthase